jgi:hypothetical protein
MFFDLASHMRSDCFRGKGPLRYYVYEWTCGDSTVYVGRGCDGRWDKFYTTKKYGDEERHKFVRDRKLELKCSFAVVDVPLCAAKEAEAVLIGHWGLKKNGGTLFNDRTESPPILDDLGEDRRQFARFNIPAIVPSAEKCLANGAFYETWNARNKRELIDDDLIVFTGSPSCWGTIHHGKPVKGSRLDHEVLRRCLPATVSEIVEMAKEYGFRPNDVRGKRGHLYWGLDKGYLTVEESA